MRRLVAGAVAAAACGAAMPSGAVASLDDHVRCTSEAPGVLTPGLRSVRGSGRYAVSGRPALTCVGSFADATVAGAGSYVLSGSYGTAARAGGRGDDCTGGAGSGTLNASVPVVTVLGSRWLHFVGRFTYVQVGLTRRADGSGVARIGRQAVFARPGSETYEERAFTFSVVTQLAPTTGDCLVRPLTAARFLSTLDFGPR